MSDKDCVLMVPSHKRAGRVTTHQFVEGVKICVPQSQMEAYKLYHPARDLIPHPDDVIGHCRKLQWMMDRFAPLFILDDDVIGMYRIYLPGKNMNQVQRKRMASPKHTAAVIQNCHAVAEQMGAFLFGFNSHAHPRTFNQFRPFGFGGYTPSGAVGIREGSKLFMPDTELPVGDYWLCALNAAFHRYSWYDKRFAFGFKDTYTGQGGFAEFRHPTSEQDGTKYLQAAFGADVILDTSQNKAGGLTKVVRNHGRRSLRLPYQV